MILRLTRPKIAFVDQRLGRGQLFGAGLEFVHELEVTHPEMLVAMVSGCLTDETRQLAYRLGAELVIEKVEGERGGGGAWIPVERILAHFEGRDPVPTSPPAPHTLRTLATVKRAHLINALTFSNGSVTRAAKRLGIPPWSLRRWLDRFEREEQFPPARPHSDRAVTSSDF